MVSDAFDSIVAGQLTDAALCEGTDDEGCVLAAPWVYRHGCGEVWLLCTPHRVILDRYLRKMSSTICDRCNKPMPRRITWSQL